MSFFQDFFLSFEKNLEEDYEILGDMIIIPIKNNFRVESLINNFVHVYTTSLEGIQGYHISVQGRKALTYNVFNL